MEIKQANVVFLATSLIRGGDRADFYNFAPNLLGESDKRFLLSLFKTEGNLKIEGQNVISLGWSSWVDYPKAIYRLAKFIRNEDIHLIHSFSRCSNIVSYLAVKLSGRPVKTVMTVISQLSKPAAMEPTFGWKIWTMLERKVYPKAGLLLCNSANAAREAVNSYGCKQEKVKIVKNFVQVEEIRQKITGLQVGDMQEYGFYFLGAGRFVKAKGFEYLLRAYALAREKTNLNLVIAGDGPLLPQMKKLAGQLGISGNVFFLGWVDDVIPLYRKATVFIAPSHYEGLPYSILEAFAAGIPVITTRSTSWIDEFEASGACITVPIGDVVSLSAAMLRVASDENLRKKLSGSAQRAVLEFGKEKVLAEWESLLRKVLL